MIARRQFLAAGAASMFAASLGGRARAAGAAATDVIVIGAGLSGLRAALDLEEQGFSVQVIEGRQRVGGRVYSLKELPGAPEAGGNGFGPGYGRCIDTAKRLGVPLMDMYPRQQLNQLALALQGRIIPAAQWESSPANILPDAYRHMMPFAIAGALFARTNPLKSSDDWYDPAFARFDRPVHELYRAQGFSDAQIELAYNINAYYGTSSHDVSQLLAYFNDIWVRGMMSMKAVSYACVGGNLRLPEAMARQLKHDIHFGRSVVGVRSDDSGVDVQCADGRKYRAKFAICTMPLPVMRFVHFDPPLPELHSKAVKTVSYIPVTQVHMIAKSKFWEDDGLPNGIWSDSLVGTFSPQRQNASSPEITSFVAFARGYGAVRLDQYEPETAKKMVIADIERLRPAAKGKLEAVVLKSWNRDPFTGGDWAIWAPGQVTELVPEVAKPHGRIHFAGEHTAKSNRGMEGAQESGERAALEVATLL